MAVSRTTGTAIITKYAVHLDQHPAELRVTRHVYQAGRSGLGHSGGRAYRTRAFEAARVRVVIKGTDLSILSDLSTRGTGYLRARGVPTHVHARNVQYVIPIRTPSSPCAHAAAIYGAETLAVSPVRTLRCGSNAPATIFISVTATP